MDVSLDEINSANNCLVIAPAGCGKTETIVKLIKMNKSSKKCLILTHTNAGVETIIDRIKKNNINSSNYNIYTIASFCKKYVQSFPTLSNIDNFGDVDYDEIYHGMSKLLENKHIKLIIENTYEVSYVDEYQDCTIFQHDMIKKLSKIIKCKLFGDSLQSIYDFGNTPIIKFEDVAKDGFTKIGELSYPWRWERQNKELGKWIMSIRKRILNNEKIYLTNLPPCVELIKSSNDNTDFITRCYKEKDTNVMVIFKIKQTADYLCRRLRGIYAFQEEIECKELKESLKIIDSNISNISSLKELINIANKCFIKFNSEYKSLKEKIEKNNYSITKRTKNIEEIKLCEKLSQSFNYYDCLKLIDMFENNKNIYLYRKEMLKELKAIFNKGILLNNSISLEKCLYNQRNKSENYNKYKYNKMFSRVLLVKGLEYSTVIIHNAEILTKEEFYVSISRPTNKLIITVDKNYLQFQ